MKKCFTLVDLIFVILIIGVLAAAAVPQFQNLKQNAEANNVVKTTFDGASSAASAAVNQLDLEDAVATSLTLKSLVSINGKGWSYDAATNNGVYTYQDPNDTAAVAQIDLNATGRTVTFGVDCQNLGDTMSQEKCCKVWTDANDTAAVTLNF